MGFVPDDLPQTRHQSLELADIFIAERRFSVRVEDINPGKPRILPQHGHQDGSQTVPGLVREGPDKEVTAQPIGA